MAALALAAYMLVVGVSCSTQRKLLYFPSHAEIRSRLAPWFVHDRLYGFARPVERPARVWLMLHGNAGQAAQRDYVLSCANSDDAVYVLEYPGYGDRGGEPTKASIDDAARAAYRELRRRYDGIPVGVIGESLGSGPACVLARETPSPDRIVLIAPFDDLVSVAAEHMWFLPVRLILQDRWDNVAALRGYRGRVDIYAAAFDVVIPPRHAWALADACGAAFTLLPCGHNDWAATDRVKL